MFLDHVSEASSWVLIGDRTLHTFYDDHIAFATERLHERFRGGAADFVIVDTNIGHDLAARHMIGDVDYRNAGRVHLFDTRDQRLVIDRREHDGVRFFHNHVFDLAGPPLH